jgi:hypothetical protein
LSGFFVSAKKFSGGVVVPIGAKVPVEVFLQKLGVISQAGMIRIVDSVMKYVIEL